MYTALVQTPFGRGLNGMGPELEHPRGDEPQQDHREEGDIVYAVFGLHPRDKSWAPRTVLDRCTHA